MSLIMTSSRPYLIRALYEWILDNEMTPYMLVNAEAEDTVVPMEYAQNGNIILNLSPGAIRDLDLGNEHISFNARFGGTPMDVFVPIAAVRAVYARENGKGMVFSDEPNDEPPTPTTPDEDKSGRPTLRVVK
jgi:stringent starvation protein B